ncbi:MAG: hypothetical protein ACOYXM_03365 [Actinomycetota bacterium]
MTTWGVTAGCLVLALGVSACGGDGGGAAPTTTDGALVTSTTSTAPERQASTTTTAYAPTSVEGEVEAAYLRSWDVYADAVYNLELDEQKLAEVYAGDYLATVTAEIEARVQEARAALVRVEHDYSVEVVDDTTAAVVDRYRNHQVLIDPRSKQPVEPDPDEEVVDVITLTLIGGEWKVTLVEELR